MRRYFVFLNNKQVDSAGRYGDGVSAFSRQDAFKVLREAKAFYRGKNARWMQGDRIEATTANGRKRIAP